MFNLYGMMLSTTENLYEEEIWSRLSDYVISTNERMMFFCGRPLESTYEDERFSNVIFNLMKLMPLKGLISLTGSLNYYVGSSAYKSFLSGLHNVPIVSISVPIEGCGLVHCDNYMGSYELCMHLIKHGYKRFGMINGPSRTPESNERFRGIEDALLQNGIREYYSVEGDFSEQSGYEGCIDLLKNSLEVILCSNDLMAIGAMRAIDELGMCIPDEIAIVGFDDIEQVRLLEIPLTTVKQPFSEMACKAFDLLKTGSIHHECIPAKQVIRESCGCPKAFKSIEHEEKDKRYYMNRYAQSLNEYTLTIRLRSSFDQVRNYEELFAVSDEYMEKIGGEQLHLCLFEDHKQLVENPLEYQWPSHMNYAYGYINGKRLEPRLFTTSNGLPASIMIESGSKAYLFYPIHLNSSLYGYIVTDSHTARSRLFTSFKREITNTLGRIDMMHQIQTYTKQMEKLAETDMLTGLMNRRGFYDYVQRTFETDKQSGGQPGIIFCDVNGLKKVNDNYGHATGDQLIIDTASVLTRVFKDYALARMGGDEFVIYVPRCEGDLLKRVNSELQSEIIKFNAQSKHVYQLSLEAGMAHYDPRKHKTLEELIKDADQHLYAKKEFRNS
jgi:diguanylate cyclase (GGDEF)-like protein